MNNLGWIRSDMQARIDPPPIPLVKLVLDYDRTTHIIKVKMRINPSSAISETYNVNMKMFGDVQLEGLLSLLRNFKIATYGNGTTTPSGRNNHLFTMFCGQALR